MLSVEFSRDVIAYRLLWVCTFLFPIGMGTIPHWTSSLFYIFSLISIVYLGRQWSLPNGLVNPLFIAFLFYFLVSCLSLINSQDLGAGVRRLEKLFFLFCFIPSFLAIQRQKMNLATPFLWGLLVTGPFLAGVAVNAVYVAGLPRAGLGYNAIIFGDMAMLNALLVAAAYLTGRLTGWRAFFGCIALLASLYAAVLSGTRGAWLALPVVGLFFLWICRQRFTWRPFAVVTGVLLVFIYMLPGDPLTSGVKRVDKGIEQFVTGEEFNTSEGARIMLWQIALSTWQRNPLLGTGLGDFQYEVQRSIEEGKTELDVDFGHAHNIFLDALATTGLAGFSALVLAFFILPARFFLSVGLESPIKETNFSVLAGLTVLLSFAVFGMTEGWLARSPMISVFLFSLLVFVSSALSDENKIPLSKSP
jgi:O-antigen ligase